VRKHSLFDKSYHTAKSGQYLIFIMDLHDNSDSSNNSSDDKLKEERQRLIAQVAAIVVNITVVGALLHLEPLYNKTPYHTSALTGADWVRKLSSNDLK
jgi:RPA family protein